MMSLGLSVSEVSDWFSQATDFRGKYAAYQQQVAALRASSINPAKYPALAKQREELLTRADDINAKVQGVVSGVESLYNTVKNLLSGQTLTEAGAAVASGVTSAWEWAKKTIGLNGLGVIPALVPIAVIASAAAAVVYWMKDNADLQQRVAEQKRLEAAGMSPAAAAAVVEKTFGPAGGGLFANLGTVAKYAAIGVVAFVGYQIFVKTRAK